MTSRTKITVWTASAALLTFCAAVQAVLALRADSWVCVLRGVLAVGYFACVWILALLVRDERKDGAA